MRFVSNGTCMTSASEWIFMNNKVPMKPMKVAMSIFDNILMCTILFAILFLYIAPFFFSPKLHLWILYFNKWVEEKKILNADVSLYFLYQSTIAAGDSELVSKRQKKLLVRLWWFNCLTEVDQESFQWRAITCWWHATTVYLFTKPSNQHPPKLQINCLHYLFAGFIRFIYW